MIVYTNILRCALLAAAAAIPEHRVLFVEHLSRGGFIAKTVPDRFYETNAITNALSDSPLHQCRVARFYTSLYTYFLYTYICVPIQVRLFFVIFLA